MTKAKVQVDPVDPPLTEKLCTRCKKTLPLDSFQRDSSRASGRHSHCRECKNAFRPSVVVKKRNAAEQMAVERLIENHRAEYLKLVFSESVQAGLIDPDDRPRLPAGELYYAR